MAAAAGSMDDNMLKKLALLSDGFRALSLEYKALAARHQSLESKLSATTKELQKLRELNKSADESTHQVSVEEDSTPVRTLVEWLSLWKTSATTTTGHELALIERAEVVAHAFQPPAATGCPFGNPAAAAITRSGTPQDAARPKSRLNSMVPDMEQDFTTQGFRQGKLNCPFTADRRRSLVPPTPLSSRSRAPSAQGHGTRSKRSSFHDPLRPETVISPEGSVVRDGSIAGSGPACPIRFLGDHSPEEVARYFEEHKHELPRSHELCIKRFQSNAESIRELDAKYGNLVTMIQGLGKMHKPMMPANPIPEEMEDAVDDFDEVRSVAKSNHKVRRWAQTVGTGDDTANSDVRETAVKETAMSENAHDQRKSHWERPLREIRVGESPSRPWGVPIPSKYLDRRQSGDSVAVSLAAPVMDTSKARPSGQPDGVPEKPKGKCPFDHTKLQAMGISRPPAHQPEEQPVPQPGARDEKAAGPDLGTTPAPAAAAAAAPAAWREPPARGKATARAAPDGESSRLINEGIIIAQTGAEVSGLGPTLNKGTILIGYDAAAAAAVMKSLSQA